MGTDGQPKTKDSAIADALGKVCDMAFAWRKKDATAFANKRDHKAQSAEYKARQAMRTAIDEAAEASGQSTPQPER